MFDSNKALDKNILKSSLQILWGGPFDRKDQWSWWQFSWKNSNDSTQIAGWSNAWEIARTIKIAKPSAVQSPHLFTSCQRIPDHVGESDCWSRRWKLSRLWFMWHLSQTTGNRWNGNGYLLSPACFLLFPLFNTWWLSIMNYKIRQSYLHRRKL